MPEMDEQDVRDVATALYRLEWQADLYATHRGSATERYESRARRLLASGMVVPTRRVRALDALAHSKNVRVYGDYGAGWRDGVMTALRSLLGEPATDLVRQVEELGDSTAAATLAAIQDAAPRLVALPETSPEITQVHPVLADDDALYALMAEGDAWVVVKDSWRPWIVTSNDQGDLWAHSWLQEDEDTPYRMVEALEYPLTVLGREQGPGLPLQLTVGSADPDAPRMSVFRMIEELDRAAEREEQDDEPEVQQKHVYVATDEGTGYTTLCATREIAIQVLDQHLASLWKRAQKEDWRDLSVMGSFPAWARGYTTGNLTFPTGAQQRIEQRTVLAAVTAGAS